MDSLDSLATMEWQAFMAVSSRRSAPRRGLLLVGTIIAVLCASSMALASSIEEGWLAGDQELEMGHRDSAGGIPLDRHPSPSSAAAPGSSPEHQGSETVHIFYYAWFGTPEIDGKWQVWAAIR